MSISKVFNFKGEKFFREIEEKITLNLLKKKKNNFSFRWWSFYE